MNIHKKDHLSRVSSDHEHSKKIPISVLRKGVKDGKGVQKTFLLCGKAVYTLNKSWTFGTIIIIFFFLDLEPFYNWFRFYVTGKIRI